FKVVGSGLGNPNKCSTIQPPPITSRKPQIASLNGAATGSQPGLDKTIRQSPRIIIRRMTSQQNEPRNSFNQLAAQGQQLCQMSVELPSLSAHAVTITRRIEDHAIIAPPAFDFAPNKRQRVISNPANRRGRQPRQLSIPP